ILLCIPLTALASTDNLSPSLSSSSSSSSSSPMASLSSPRSCSSTFFANRHRFSSAVSDGGSSWFSWSFFSSTSLLPLPAHSPSSISCSRRSCGFNFFFLRPLASDFPSRFLLLLPMIYLRLSHTPRHRFHFLSAILQHHRNA